MNFDTDNLPNLSRYISALPQGISSYPDCQLKSDILEDLKTDFPKLVDNPDLPQSVIVYLKDPDVDGWLPVVVGNALLLAVRDIQFKTDEAFLDWCRENMNRLFTKPVYRIAMKLFSTSLLVMGTAKRWATFHRGSQLLAKPIKKIDGRLQAVAILSYPQNLFSGLIVSQLAASFLAALDSNNAVEPLIKAKEQSQTESLFFISWKA